MIIGKDELDFDLAVRRVVKDMRDDWFDDPLRYSDILTARNVREWYESSRLIKEAEQLNVPKSGFVIRSAQEMFIYERVLYQALVDKLIEDYDGLLRDTIYSHRLRKGKEDYIFQNTIEAWKSFNSDTRISLDSESKYVVITDIQNYFQCIRCDVLCDQLEDEEPNSSGLYKGTISNLKELLLGWSSAKYGLPQNRDASSFLGNIFLRGVDEHMILKGYNYMRYMDDIRIICDDKYSARKALQDLIIKLRDIHLTVNSKKTKIVNREDQGFHDEVPRENHELAEIEALFKKRKVRSVQVAKEKLDALADKLISEGKTSSKEFRFCMNRIERLARCEDIEYDPSRFIDAAISLLVEEPWSSEMLIRLLKSAQLSEAQIEEIVKLVLCPLRNIYEWQSFLLWQLVAILNPGYKKDELKSAARSAISSNRRTPFKAGAALYIGVCGNIHDRSHLLQESVEVNSNMLLRSIAIATQSVKTAADVARRESIIPKYYIDSISKISTMKSEPQFFSAPPRLKASQIYDDLPCFYF